MTEVLVVGAGPTGLMAALCLQRMAVDVVLIDAKAGPTRESRALGLQARSLEIFDQLGLVDAVLEQTRIAPGVAPGFRTRTFGRVEFATMGKRITPYPGIYVLEQSRTERILSDAFVAAGGDLRWSTELRDLHVVPDGVLARTGAGEVQARYVIAADGASSLIRKQLGVPFEGTTNPQVYFVADALGTTGVVEDAINLRVSEDDMMLTFPMEGERHHRILGVADEAPPDEVQALVDVRLERDFGVAYERASWFATYHVHHRVAARFREGAVFLVGDAAHVHSPVGAQGMNTGLQDAHNIACKLADVLRHDRRPATLDDFERERRPVALRLVGTTDRMFGVVTSTKRLARFVRRRVIPAVGPIAVRLVPRLIGTERIFGSLSQTRIHYRMPGERGRDRVVGRRLQWTGDNFAALRSFEWQVHGYGSDPSGVANELGIAGHAFPRDRHRRLRENVLYLVRPDGFVAAAAAPEAATATFGDFLARSSGLHFGSP